MTQQEQLQKFIQDAAAKIRRLEAVVGKMQGDQAGLKAMMGVIEALKPPRSVTQDIDAIDGRRIYYGLTGRVSFTATDALTRGTPITMQVSQDGPFIQTHYPLATWKPNAPTGATNFGKWSPISSTPLPTQQDTGIDIINLSYEIVDGGSQRNFQNEALPPLFSRLDNLVPLPVPTLFTPNAAIQFFPTYEEIFFATAPATDTTGGVLVVTLPGYRIVNL